MGRPALKEDEKRIVQVNIRLTILENTKACTYAQAAGLTPANWIRQKAFTGKFPVIKLSPIQAETYRELHKIGVNLNQAVKQVHSGKLPVDFLSTLTSLLNLQQELFRLLIA